jgi:hypothetical protein
MSFPAPSVDLTNLPQLAHIDPVNLVARRVEILAYPEKKRLMVLRGVYGLSMEELGAATAHDEGLELLGDVYNNLFAHKFLELPLSTQPLSLQRSTMLGAASCIYALNSNSTPNNLPQDHILPSCPWMLDVPHAMINEKDGVKFVLYDFPGSSVLTEEERDFVYSVSLNAWATTAIDVGLKVSALEVARPDFANCTIATKSVAFDETRGRSIIGAGTRVWGDVCQGVRPSPVIPVNLPALSTASFQSNSSSHSSSLLKGLLDTQDQPASLQRMGELYALWRVMALEAERNSETFASAMRAMLPVESLNPDLSELDFGPSKVKVVRKFSVDAVNKIINAKLAEAGHSQESIDAMLSSSNYNNAPSFKLPLLADKLMEKFAIDILTDPDFSACIATPSSPKVETRLELLRDLDAAASVDYNALLDLSKSSVNVELSRSGAAPAKAAREALQLRLREETRYLVENAGSAYLRQLQQNQAATNVAPVKKPPRRPRKP